MNITFPTAAELKEIEKDKLAVLTMTDPIFTILPIVTEDVAELKWEQEDNFTGLQNVRGLNGQPGKVSRTGAKQFKCEVGFYGDFEEIDEEEITKRRVLGTFNQAVSIDDVVVKRQDKLLQREIDRMRKIGWDLISTGAFSSTNQAGNIIHTDAFPIQTQSGSDWSVLASATPLADFRALKLKARGYSVRFDRTATAYMNSTTLNYMLNNTNANDLYGKRQDIGATFNTLADINKVMAAADLPQIVEYDETYFVEGSTSPTLFLANDKVTVVGKRTNNQAIGDFAQIRNANNPNAEPGPYTLVLDSLQNSMTAVPRIISVHRGWSGGTRLYFPSAIVAMSV
jgi:hypothetical protein